ncbi:SLC13 family permease [Candidatus Margulisiibacteriota bacterium]
MLYLVIALTIFVVAYIVIITERLNQTVVTLFAGALMIILGVIHQETAIEAIDFNTLGLLLGMMIIVEIIKGTGVFQYIAIKSAKLAKGNPVLILVYISIITAVASAFLDNVTTILIVLPLTFIIADTLEITPVPFLMSEILLSNIGGAATLIGDPPNILIGSAAGLGFNDFIITLAPLVMIIGVTVIFLLNRIYGKKFKVAPEVQQRIMDFSPSKLLENMKMVKRSFFVLSVTLLLFIFHQPLNLEAATVALGGAGLLLILTKINPTDILKEVEWTTIFFIMGIFVLVAGLERVGIIDFLGTTLVFLAGGNIYLLALVFIWVAGIGAAFFGAIPLVVTMIPIVQHIGFTTGIPVLPLWWSLALGACLGGNGTILGSAANVAAVGIYQNSGKRFTWLEFFRIGFPITILSLLIATVYVFMFLI